MSKISLGQILLNMCIFQIDNFKDRKGCEKEENGGGKVERFIPEASLKTSEVG